MLIPKTSILPEKLSRPAAGTVSYTHLDVYKRQAFIHEQDVLLLVAGRACGTVPEINGAPKQLGCMIPQHTGGGHITSRLFPFMDSLIVKRCV